jgi:hypothetical protein
MQMKLSDVTAFFGSKAFASWKKNKEQETKLQLAMLDRLNGVITAIGNLGKSR